MSKNKKKKLKKKIKKQLEKHQQELDQEQEHRCSTDIQHSMEEERKESSHIEENKDDDELKNDTVDIQRNSTANNELSPSHSRNNDIKMESLDREEGCQEEDTKMHCGTNEHSGRSRRQDDEKSNSGD